MAIAASLFLTWSARAADRIWINSAGGTFSLPANWQNSLVPGSDDRAVLDLSGSTFAVGFDSDVTNASFIVRDGDLSLGLNGNTYTVTHGGTDLVIGDTDGDRASVSIENGTFNTRSARLGYSEGAEGTVRVHGLGAVWNDLRDIYVGSSGSGKLVIENGGVATSLFTTYVGHRPNAKGTVLVRGVGSELTGFGLDLGHFGTGSLAIEEGGKASIQYVTFGYRSGSEGSATVTGPDSTWTTTGDFTVGFYGGGTVSIEQGGSLVNNGITSIASKTGSQGAVTVRGAGSTWKVEDDFLVGAKGKGSLAIEDGGSVTSPGGSIGFDTGSTGSVTVTGDNSIWTNRGMSVGYIGSGMLTISNGGRVISNALGNVISSVGINSTALGTVIIRGTGSSWVNTGMLDVGGKDGRVSIEDGGSMTSGNSYIGGSLTKHGTVTVSGAGSRWTSAQTVVAGGGIGQLNILNGGKVVSSTWASMGSSETGVGTAVVSGAGSSWTTADLVVGSHGTAELTISDGGIVQSTVAMIASNSGSLGSATVSGTRSIWNNSGSLHIGGRDSASGGKGSLAIDAGGKVIASDATVWTSGTLTGSGGTLEADVINRGLIAPGGPTGSISVLGDFTQLSTGKLVVDIADADSFDHLSISGQASLGGKLEIKLLDSFVPSSGTIFDILDWNASSGAFSSIVLPPLPGGKAWDTNQLYVSGILSVIGPPPIAGDFDSDNDVDGADFAVWNANFPKSASATLAKGDVDGDGDVDGADFVVWQTQLSSSAGAAASPVPEPASLTAMLFLASIVSFCRVRKVLACSA